MENRKTEHNLEALKILKSKIEKKKNSIQQMSKLIHQQIDRETFDMVEDVDSSPLLNGMAKPFMGMRILSDPRPVASDIRSHRKVTGVFIITVKKILLKVMKLYTNLLMDRQKRFNEHQLDFISHSLENQKQIEQRLDLIDEKMVELENSIDDMSEKLDTLSDQLKGKGN